MAKQVELEWLNDDDTNDSAQVGGQQPSRSFMDTIGDAINAIGANFDVVRGSNRIGDLMESLAEPDRGTTEEQYYQNLDKLQKEYAARELAQRKYQDAQDRLVAEDSFLKNITQMGGTLEGMAAQAIGTAGGAALGSVGGFAGASTGAKIGNALGAAAGGYLDARSVALEAREKVLEEGGTWEQAQEAYEEALKKASLTTIPETAVDIILGNRLLGSVSGRIGSSALLDPAAKIGTGVSRAFNPLAGRLAGFATDVALQGSTEALQEVTQDYIADREIAKALNRPDNEYSFGGFGQYAMTPQGLETMKTAGIMGALFGGIGGAISSGKYLQHGAKTREGNMTYHAVKNMEKNGDLYINPDNREAEIKTLAEMLERDGVDEGTIRGWSDAELAAASAEVRGRQVARTSPLEAQDKSIVRQAADFGNRVLSTDEHRNLRESDLTPESRELLKQMGVADDMVDSMFSTQKSRSVLDTAKKEEKTESGEEAKPVVKLTQNTINSMEQGQQQSGTERKTDGVVDDFTLEFGSENDIGENWEKVSQGDVQYEDTAIYKNRDNGRIVSVQKTRDGKIQVVDHGFNTDQDKLFNIDNFESLPKQQYSSAKEAKQKLLDNDDNKADFRFMKSTKEEKKESGDDSIFVDANKGLKRNVANDIESLAKLHKEGVINDNVFLEVSALLQRAGMTKNEHNLDFYFNLDKVGINYDENGNAIGQSYAVRQTVLGRAIVQLYAGADMGSVVHELGHNAYWNLPQEQRDIFNRYAVKTCGRFVADICGVSYNQDFVNRLKSGDKKLWESISKSGAIKQTRFLLKSLDIVNKGIMSQERYNQLRQEAIEERYAHELSAWYVEGYAKGIEPQNAIDRIKQRGCLSVANELGVLQKVWDAIHHRGGNYGDTPIEEMYKNSYGGFTGATYSTLADQSNLYLGEQLDPLDIEEVKKAPEPKPTENKNNKQPKTEYTEEEKAQNEEDKKIQNRRTVEVNGKKENVKDIISDFSEKEQKEINKLVDIVNNKKSGWQKALVQLSRYSPNLNVADLIHIQKPISESSLYSFTKTYNNPVVEEKKESAPQSTSKNDKKNNNNKQQTQAKPSSETQAKQNELFNQAEQKDPNLGKDGMAVYNKLKDKEKLSKKDKAEIKGIIDRIDALGKQHRYYPLRKNLNNLLNGIKEESQQKQNSQLEKAITEKPKTLGDSPAARAVKLIKKINDKNVMDMDEADYFVNELLGAVADLKNWNKEFDGKQDLMGQLKDIIDKIKKGDFFGEEIEEESSVQDDTTNGNNEQQKAQTPAPVTETAQPVQEVAQQPQENTTQTGEQRLAKLEEELKKLSTTRQIKSRLNKYLNNKDITKEEYDALSNKLLPKEESKPKTEFKTETTKKTAGIREYIAYAKDKDGNLQKITEEHKNKKEFEASLKERGYAPQFVAKGEEQYNEYLNKYNEAVEKARQEEQRRLEADKKKAEEAAAKKEEADKLKEETEARKRAVEGQTARKRAIEQSFAEKKNQEIQEGLKIIEENKKREAEAKNNKPESKPKPKEKVKTEPLKMSEDTLVENIITKPENGRYLKLEDGKLNYYELVENPERGINPATGKPYTKPEAKGYISQEMFDALLDAWDKLPSEIRFNRETFFRSDRGAFNNLASNTKTQAQQRVYSVCGWSEKREKIAEEKLEKVYDEINRKTEELGISDDYAKVIIDKFIDIDSLVSEGNFTEEKISEAKKDADNYLNEVNKEDNEKEWNIRKNVHDILMGAIDQAIEINKELDKRDAKNKKPVTTKKPAETKEEGQKKDAKKPATTKKPAKPKTETDPFKALHKKFKNVTGGEIGKTTVYKADEKAFIKAWMGRVDDAITSKKETLNDIIKSLEEWKQNNIDQKRTDVIYDYIQNYVIEAGKQFPDAVQNNENKDTRSQMSTQRVKQAQQILNKAFPDTRFQYAWHSTRHNFTEFTLNNLLGGEGCMAHGWGLYFGLEWRKNKKYYFDRFRYQMEEWDSEFSIYGDFDAWDELEMIDYLEDLPNEIKSKIKQGSDIIKTIIPEIRKLEEEIEEIKEEKRKHEDNLYENEYYDEEIGKVQPELDRLNSLVKVADAIDYLAYNPKDGIKFLLVDIPDNDVLLIEGRGFAAQPPKVKRALIKLARQEKLLNGEENTLSNKDLMEHFDEILGINEEDWFGDVYNTLAWMLEDDPYGVTDEDTTEQGKERASKLLNKYGIKGILYDGNRDGKCAVIFDDKSIDILSKFKIEEDQWERTVGNNTRNIEEQKKKAQNKLQKRKDLARRKEDERHENLIKLANSPSYDTRSQLHSEKGMQKADINSPAFKEWFKGSILKNKDGSPKVFYRGIRGHYDPTYDKEEGGAVWIAEERQFAEDFRDVVTYEDVVKQTGKVEKLSYIDRGSNIESGDIAEVYASVKKPFNVEQIMRFDSNHDQYVHIGKMLGRDVEKGIITSQQRLQVLRDLSYLNKMTKRGTYPNVGHVLAHHFKDKRFFDAFKKVGYDSIQGYESDVMTYGVFDKGNVKSIYNKGTFNRNDKDIRNMAIGEFGKNSPLANKEFKNKLEQAWEKSYRKWGSRLNYSNEEIEESLSKYKNIEDEKVFDKDQDKLAEIYSRLNDYVNGEFWRQGIGKDVEGTRARFRRELDGRWRFYIPDNKMQFKPRINNLLKLKNTGKKLTLDQVIKHDLLFKYYPDLKKIEVEICDSTYDKELKDSTSAYYDANEETIVLNAKDLSGDIREVQRTMLHEIQHIIQDEEGFAQGGSPEDFAGHQKQLTSFAKGIFKKKEEFRRHLLNNGFDEKTVQAKLDTYFFKDEKSLENIIKNTLNKNPSGKFGKEFKNWIASNNKIYNEYKNLLGEIEARDTEKRFDYTDEQLQSNPPMIYNESINSLKHDENGKVIARKTRDKRAIKDSRSQLKSEKGMPIADTNTPAFKKWFGKSTAINSDGSPRVFYRGQGHEYDPNYKFDKTDANRNKLTWVAQTKQFIEDGAYNGLDGEGDLWEVYIRTENPFNMGLIDSSTDEAEKTPMELYEHVINKLKREVKYRRITPKQFEETKEKLSYLRQNRRSDGKIQNYKSPIYYFLDKDTKLVGALKDLGYDSILGIEDDTNTFALFDPNQVKSIYNDGQWSHPTDIRHQKASESLEILQRAFPDTRFQYAWHGTPHDFTEFTLKHLLSGEGAMVHGWGLYFAKEVRIGKGYYNALSNRGTQIYLDNKNIIKEIEELLVDTEVGEKLYLGKEVRKNEIIDELISVAKDQQLENEKYERELKTLDKNDPRYPSVKEIVEDGKVLLKRDNEYLRKFLTGKIKVENQIKDGILFKVEIPEDNVLLRERSGFKNQPKFVQKQLLKLFKKEFPEYVEKLVNDGLPKTNMYTNPNSYESIEYDIYNAICDIKYGNMTLAEAKKLGKSNDVVMGEISQLLNKYGIKGISYDGQFDGECVVVFDDTAIDIINKFRQEEGKWKSEKVDNARNREVDKQKAQRKLEKRRLQNNDIRSQMKTINSENREKVNDIINRAREGWKNGVKRQFEELNNDKNIKLIFKGEITKAGDIPIKIRSVEELLKIDERYPDAIDQAWNKLHKFLKALSNLNGDPQKVSDYQYQTISDKESREILRKYDSVIDKFFDKKIEMQNNDTRSQKKSKKERKQEQKEYVKRETADAIEKGEITDTYKDVYSVSFDESAQNNSENQKKMKYFNDRSEFWDRHESNGTVTYTRKTPFEHHQKVVKYSGINGVQKTMKEKSKPRQWYEWFKDQAIKYLFNDKQYLAKLARHLGVYDAYTRMMVTEGYAQRANVALTEGIMYNGKRTRALNDIIKTVGYQKQKRFLDYCIAHRILNLKERDPKIEQKMSLEEAHEIIEREQNGADAKLFEDNRVDFVDYNKALLHVLVDGGIISEDTFQKFCKNDPDFVPLAKVLDGADLGFNSIIHAHSLINVKSPVKKIGTSMREVKNPFLEMQKRTAEYYSIAARNRAGQIFVNEICGKLDTMFDGDTVQRGAGIIRKVRVDEQNGKLITKPDDQKQIIYVCNNGKHEFYQVADREIYLALKSLSDDQMNTLTKMIDRVAHAPAHLIRESATIVPDFGVRNLIRDNFEAFLTSEHGFIPFFDAMWGVYQMANNTEWYQRYLDQVGEYGTLNRESQRVDNLATYSSTIDDKISYAQNLKEIYKEQMAIIKDTNKAYSDVINEKNSPQRKLLAFMKLFVSPIWAGGKSLKRFNDYMEQGTRIGEFKNAKKKYEGLLDRLGKDALKWNIGFDAIKDNSDIMAAGAAKEITLNFAQHGSLGKMINRWVPFFNATMQGVYKFGNTMDLLFKGNDMSNNKNRRLQKELAFKTALMVAFGIGVAAAGEGDEDYDEAPEWEKKNFWIFPNGMRLPKDQVLGTIVGTAAEESYRQWRKGKAEPSKLLEIICEHFSPNNITPAIIDTMFVGFMANYDSFKKQDIVPEYMKQRRGFLQKDLNTANVAVAISEALYNTLGWDVSAKKIDFAINKNLSNTAKYMNAILDLGLAKNEKMARGYDKSDSTGAFVGGLRDRVPTPLNLVTGTFATNRTSYQSINEFYDKYNKLKIASSHEQSMTEEEKRLWKRYQKAYKEDTKLRKQLREIKNNASLNKDQKREKADPIFKKQIKLAKWAEGE